MCWLFDQFWQAQRTKWYEWTGIVTATEVGVGRALSVILGGKGKGKPKPLPTWAQVIGDQEKTPRSDFTSRFERAQIAQRQAQELKALSAEPIEADDGDH